MAEATVKRERVDSTFSMDPDIEIHAGDEIVEAHSIILMMSSPVFRQMLSTNMSEGRSGTIHLPEKNAVELRCFLDSLSRQARFRRSQTRAPCSSASGQMSMKWGRSKACARSTSSSTCPWTARPCGMRLLIISISAWPSAYAR
mmetsp:Transcript_12699/g.28945  ORF Transcript_12699/g.28945 Transcript_12699/m.28945 type:complete len:144 (+) Transcript_12699:67-498(+)